MKMLPVNDKQCFEFSSLIGQSTTVSLLQGAIAKNRAAPAYLFAGVDGVGKTLAARSLYLVFLAPASQRQQAREWLLQQTSTSTPPMQPQLAETVEEPKLQLHIEPDLVEDFWLAEPRSIATANQESHVAIASAPLLLLPPARLISEQSATVALANSKATKIKQAKALANTPGTVPAAFGHMTATQLRKLCSNRNIKWRNVRDSKHLSKAEMIIALAAA